MENAHLYSLLRLQQSQKLQWQLSLCFFPSPRSKWFIIKRNPAVSSHASSTKDGKSILLSDPSYDLAWINEKIAVGWETSCPTICPTLCSSPSLSPCPTFCSSLCPSSSSILCPTLCSSPCPSPCNHSLVLLSVLLSILLSPILVFLYPQ